MDNPAEKPPQKAAPKPLTFAQVLETSPPDVAEDVSERTGLTVPIRGGGQATCLAKPDLQLHCDDCEGVRTFYCSEKNEIFVNTGPNYIYLPYLCRNCRSVAKVFSIVVLGKNKVGSVQKLGENPPFGPPTPPRVFKLIGEEYRELFLQGRRAENKGLGIGAYAYYRRIVEHQKGQIIEEIGKVAKKLGATPEVMKTFTDARSETQFATAIEKIKAGIPQSLLIDNHNPLTLLHTALSEGLHEQTDEECLALATSIRVVLTELADRISTALKEEASLKS